MDLTRTVVEDAIRSFLAEDVGYGDITTNALLDSELKAEGQVVCKENAAIAGIEAEHGWSDRRGPEWHDGTLGG